jgi:hypothetical protein
MYIYLCIYLSIAGHIARMGERRGEYMLLPEGRRLLERPRHKWKNNIKMVFETYNGVIVWIDRAQDRDR